MSEGVEPVLEARSITRRFIKDAQRVEVLRGVDLQVRRGEAVVITGASGVGKSTLIHILGALDRPSEGAVLYEGEDVFRMDDRSLAAFRNRRIGFVFQFHYLLSELTALENVMVPALILGLSRARAREKAEAVLESLGLGDRLTHRPGELSGGEQQRVAIARALVLRPPVVLADEPTGNLDERTGDRVSDLLLEMREVFGTTLVVVTHNMRLASKMDRRLELAEGRLRERPISGPDP